MYTFSVQSKQIVKIKKTVTLLPIGPVVGVIDEKSG